MIYLQHSNPSASLLLPRRESSCPEGAVPLPYNQHGAGAIGWASTCAGCRLMRATTG